MPVGRERDITAGHGGLSESGGHEARPSRKAVTGNAAGWNKAKPVELPIPIRPEALPLSGHGPELGTLDV